MPRFTPKTFLILALFGFVGISLILYNNVETRANQRDAIFSKSEHEISKLKDKLLNLGKELEKNDKEMSKLEKKLDNVDKTAGKNEENVKVEENIVLPPPNFGGGKVKIVHDVLNKITTTKQSFKEVVKMVGKCPIIEYGANSTIQMLKAYDIIPFDNPDGGVWKQGWDIQYDKNEILKEKKLEVVVVPHSHDDPGWLQTFEGYYQSQTKGILDGMLNSLTKYDDMKFIYAEMSFFELWWSNLDSESRRTVKGFLDKGQLEIVTGAWVMTDEANSHYYSTIMEMFEGHEFLKNQLDYKPTSHWSIDPFGLSPTITYIAKTVNLTHAAVQRVHYSVKKYLAKEKNLEFKWRQLWSGKNDKTDMFTHMFPFYSYDVPHTCGPDPKICCSFDFKRMYTSHCPWGIPPTTITDQNVVERATVLADQYRKKAQLYKTNVLLVPLGDDFRYDDEKEWQLQHDNYIKLFKQMNADTTLNIHARFGTLNDYFSLLEKRKIETKDGENLFEILSGDFFTYADRDDHYWSGYYTSRPFYKHMDRTLQHYLRSADILFSLTNWNKQIKEKIWKGLELYQNLVDSRRSLSLFQHHDGVTGTARDPVVVDYGEKMLAALNWCKNIIESSAEYLLDFPSMREEDLKVDEIHYLNELPKKVVIEDGATIVLHNSLGYERKEVVCIHVNSIKSKIGIGEDDKEEILQQIGPVLNFISENDRFVIDKDKFELCFLAIIPPFGLKRYQIFEAQDSSSSVTITTSGNLDSSDFIIGSFTDSKLLLKNDKVEVEFNPQSGFLQSIKLKDSEIMPIELNFVNYGARKHNSSFHGGDSLSGAYLFLPDSEAKQLSNSENMFIVIDGQVRKTIHVKGIKQILLTHSVSLDYGKSDLLIKNQVDIRSTSNFETAMRIKTGIIDGENFYSDLNAYQMIKRKRFEKLPLQAHFYPMPSSAYLENNSKRITLIGRQALGVASLKPGWIEVMLDRRLDQDDDRGLVQPVHDNLRTESLFRIILEEMTGKQNDNATIGYHTLESNFIMNELHYPPIVIIGQFDHAASAEIKHDYQGLNDILPCDIHPVTLRTLSLPTIYGDGGTRSTNPQNSIAFILHRLGIECRSKTINERQCNYMENDKMKIKNLFTENLKSAQTGSLTLLYSDEKENIDEIEMTPMELKTIKLNF